MDEHALAAWQRALVDALLGATSPADVRTRLAARADVDTYREMLARLDDRGLAIAIALVARWSSEAPR